MSRDGNSSPAFRTASNSNMQTFDLSSNPAHFSEPMKGAVPPGPEGHRYVGVSAGLTSGDMSVAAHRPARRLFQEKSCMIGAVVAHDPLPGSEPIRVGRKILSGPAPSKDQQFLRCRAAGQFQPKGALMGGDTGALPASPIKLHAARVKQPERREFHRPPPDPSYRPVPPWNTTE